MFCRGALVSACNDVGTMNIPGEFFVRITGRNSFVIDVVGNFKFRAMIIRTECKKNEFRFIEVQLPMVTPFGDG